MGNYISRTDVQRRLRRSYETLYTVEGALDTDVVDADIEGAEAEVDSYIGQRYAVPVTDATALRIVKDWSLTLLEERAYGALPGRDLPEAVKGRVKAVREQLANVARGRLTLAGAAAAENTDVTGLLVVDGSTAVFGRDNMAGF